MTLSDISASIGRTKSPVNRILLQLTRLGRVRRIGTHPDITYGLLPFVGVEWVAHEWAQDARPPTWFRTTWSVTDRVDWRFPLVTRLPDERARDVLQQFLLRAWEKGYFTPWLLPYLDASRNDHNLTWTNMDVNRRMSLMKDPRNHGPVTFVAYGSTARGDARRDSDVDLLAITPIDPSASGVPQFPYKSRLEDLADTINLGASRQLDLMVVSEDDLYDHVTRLPAGLARSISEEGLTIFTTDPTGFAYAERWKKQIPSWREAGGADEA